ncbi:MAG: DMT family transporter [Solidesulfovibrio sp. DCME]|uniref:DMT family transporter n=1 Tax=Solidesulfovibrio sp. DCME TaxID=3447380 RepID=UPI003D0C41EE
MGTWFAPAAFVLLWSTGFIVARAIAGQADAPLFLTARFAVAACLLAVLAGRARAAWPRGRRLAGHLGAGALLHGIYLAASYQAVALGLSPGVMALVASLQPPLTAGLAAICCGRRPGGRLTAGMAAALAGVVLAAWPGREAVVLAMPLLPLGLAFCAMVSITAGTLAQQSALAAADLRVAGALQHAGAALVTLVVTAAWGQWRFVPTVTVLGALGWSVAGLSLGGAGLLVWLVRRGEAAGTAALLFLAPPLAALQAWLFFGTPLGARQLAGFALTLAGVALARGERPSRQGSK